MEARLELFQTYLDYRDQEPSNMRGEELLFSFVLWKHCFAPLLWFLSIMGNCFRIRGGWKPMKGSEIRLIGL
jgi:hypothetical protein